MIPDPLCYQLLLVGLVWLCLMLHVVWPYDRAPSGPTTPRPAKAPCKRSKAPKPFSGLLVVYLLRADKCHGPTWGPSQEQHGTA